MVEKKEQWIRIKEWLLNLKLRTKWWLFSLRTRLCSGLEVEYGSMIDLEGKWNRKMIAELCEFCWKAMLDWVNFVEGKTYIYRSKSAMVIFTRRWWSAKAHGVTTIAKECPFGHVLIITYGATTQAKVHSSSSCIESSEIVEWLLCSQLYLFRRFLSLAILDVPWVISSHQQWCWKS